MAATKLNNDLHLEITNKIIAELEQGRIPWVRPWKSSAPEMPRNGLTGRAYSGVNVLLTWISAAVFGFNSSSWFTYKQAESLGAQVRRGEKGTMLVYASMFVPKQGKDGEEPRPIPFLKRYVVFNADQIDGLPERFTAAPEAIRGEREQVEAADKLIAASGVPFHIRGNDAFYSPSLDFIQVPDQRQFHEPINWYRTALHELTHATGHKTRLDRDQTGSFGSEKYAREELVAEMGSAFLCATLGITATVRHADYIGSWLEVLRNDKRAIFKAASAASKAAEWLVARQSGNIDETEIMGDEAVALYDLAA